jgi:hypothetical protein
MNAVISILGGIVKFFGPVVVTAALIIGYYEGIPGLRDIPFIGRVPVIREFIVGRVEIESGKAAAAAREGYVARTALTAAQAEAERYRIQAIQNAAFAEQAREQAKTANAERDRDLGDQEKKNDADTDPEVSRWRQYDLDRYNGVRRPAGPAASPP